VRIVRFDVFGYELTYAGGTYAMSGGRVVERLASTVVRIVTDEGLEGYGETCPLGPAYLPAHAEGARAALRELAPAVLGLNPTEPTVLYDRMDAALAGHAYAKSAVDIACWDVLGHAAGLPACALLGGRRQASFPLYIAVPLGPVEEMAASVERHRAEGVHSFQLKLGADPYEDARRVRAVLDATTDGDVVIADANGGWRLPDAMIAARLLDEMPRLFFEQPCATLAECLSVRRHTSLPFILDEVITDIGSFLWGWREQAMDAINLKLSKVGGLTPARQLRELAETLGIALTIEDSWGGDLATAAVAHLAASTRPEALFTVSFMNDWTNEHVAGHRPRSKHGRGSAPTTPGLGVEVDAELLGEPFFSVRS
jgi:L-alanine-DL-glutamate epimerase-like enolase superfamily enzyme